jgi:hypothetical protein
MSYIADYYDEHFGHASSVSAGASIDATQSPIPWITYAALFQLEQYDFGNCKVFEWGSGYSSLFWSPRVHSLVSIDHDPSWHEFVVQKNLSNVEARLVDLAKYADSIVGAAELFDVIVIDGYIHEATRYHCARLCTEYLAPGGSYSWTIPIGYPIPAATFAAWDTVNMIMSVLARSTDIRGVRRCLSRAR